jgi:dimethylamine monooxygenase subunit A
MARTLLSALSAAQRLSDCMLPHFPLTSDTYAMTIGARPLGGSPLIEVDALHYRDEIALKERILAADHRYYYRELPGSEAAQWETLALVLRDMAAHASERFHLTVQGERWTWRNRLLGCETSFTYGDPASLPQTPLDWAGRQVQEDLILLAGDTAAGLPLVAGQLCFGNGWCLEDKLGRPLLEVHSPVPGYADQVGRSTDLLMERLKPARPVFRVNWSIKASPQLDASPRHRAFFAAAKQGVTAANAGERLWLRVERQGLAKLPQTGAIVFTLHTYQQPIAELVADHEHARRLRGVLRTAPPALLAYKGIEPVAAALAEYLDSHLFHS